MWRIALPMQGGPKSVDDKWRRGRRSIRQSLSQCVSSRHTLYVLTRKATISPCIQLIENNVRARWCERLPIVSSLSDVMLL
jgi:D-aminopeptidase